jgi:hypothetical protein
LGLKEAIRLLATLPAANPGQVLINAVDSIVRCNTI